MHTQTHTVTVNGCLHAHKRLLTLFLECFKDRNMETQCVRVVTFVAVGQRPCISGFGHVRSPPNSNCLSKFSSMLRQNISFSWFSVAGLVLILQAPTMGRI